MSVNDIGNALSTSAKGVGDTLKNSPGANNEELSKFVGGYGQTGSSAGSAGGEAVKEIGDSDPTGAKTKAANKAADDKVKADAEAAAVQTKDAANSAAIKNIGTGQVNTAGAITLDNQEHIDKLNALGTATGTALTKVISTLEDTGNETKKLTDSIPGMTDALSSAITKSSGELNTDKKAVTDIADALKEKLAASTAGLADKQKLVEEQTGKIDQLLKDNDPKKIAQALTEQQNDVTKQKMELAQKSIDQSQDLAKWYQGIATNYSDIATRYRDAVTGLTGAEQAGMKNTAAQDSAAMSAVSAQGAASAFKGRALTTGQQAAFMATGQQAAASAYSSALDRMSQIDEQRRQMQFNIVNASGQQELANRQGGAAMQSNQIGMQSAQRMQQANYMQTGQDANAQRTYNAGLDTVSQGMQGITTSLAGIQQMANYDMSAADIGIRGAQTQGGLVDQSARYSVNQADMAKTGFDASMSATAMSAQLQQQRANIGIASGNMTMTGANFQQGTMDEIYGLHRDTLESQLAAGTYADVAGIAQREGTFSQMLGVNETAAARTDASKAKSAAQAGQVAGVVGAVVGAYASGSPQGAAAGYQVGQGAGQAASY